MGEADWRTLVTGWFPGLTDTGLRQTSWPVIEAHRDYIAAQLRAGVTAATIHQRLSDEHGLTASVASVRRWVAANLPEDARRGQVTVLRDCPPPGARPARMQAGRRLPTSAVQESAGRPNPPSPPMRVDMHAHHRDVAATDHWRRPMHMRLTTRRRIRLGTTVGALVTIGLTGAVGFGSAPATAAAGSAAAIAATDTDRVPPEIQVPPGNKLVAEFDAQGVQVYQCTAGAWSFLEPAAVLSARIAAAVHFRGPSWESTQDGSLVEGRSVASSPVAGSIPQLLLQATRTRGDGVFGGVTYIQRLNTTGGVAPTTACTDGQTKGVPYTADYLFYATA